MSLLVVGSVAFDALESPYGKVDRTLGGAAGEARLTQLAEEVAERKIDPFSAVNDILARSGLDESAR